MEKKELKIGEKIGGIDGYIIYQGIINNRLVFDRRNVDHDEMKDLLKYKYIQIPVYMYSPDNPPCSYVRLDLDIDYIISS